MTLKELCEKISCNDSNMLSEDNPVGLRIMRPEYSLDQQEVKTYPFPSAEHLFSLCWIFRENRRLYSTIKPSAESFSYSCSFYPGDKTQLHTHDYLELSYIVSGQFKQRILGKDIIFKQGELCLIDKNCLHQDYLEDNGASILFLGIANDTFDEIMSSHAASDGILGFLQSALQKQKKLQQYLHFKPLQNPRSAYDNSQTQGKLEECLIRLLQELILHDEASPLICQGLLSRIFRILSTQYDFSLSRELREKMHSVMYEEITAYIREHLQDISIGELCAHFHFQEDYFNRLIKKQCNMTYTEYVQELRLAQSKHLLLNSDASIEEIAGLVGYQNKGYFYRIFQNRYQLTPAKYRKKYGG